MTRRVASVRGVRLSRASPAMLATLAVTFGLAVVGAVLAARMAVGTPDRLPPSRVGIPAPGDEVGTSFGTVAVQRVDRLTGQAARHPAGAAHGTHGIHGVIDRDEALVEVAVALTNLRGRPLPYSPDLFQLRAGRDGNAAPPTSSTTQPGRLEPGTGIELLLTFVTSHEPARLWLEFRDPGRARPILVDLGRVGPRPPATSKEDGHEH